MRLIISEPAMTQVDPLKTLGEEQLRQEVAFAPEQVKQLESQAKHFEPFLNQPVELQAPQVPLG